MIFDSTGSGVQDVAVAWAAYQAARTLRSSDCAHSICPSGRTQCRLGPGSPYFENCLR